MFKSARLLLSLSLLTFGAHAAKPVTLPLPIAEDLPVEVIQSQEEIAVTVPATAVGVGAQFGLVGALIGTAVQNAQTKKAEASIVPLRNLLVDYPFDTRMAEALQAKLPSDGVSLHPVITVMDTPWEARELQQSGALPPMALVITPAYAMDSDFSRMTVSLLAQVNDRVVKSNGKIKSVPRFSRSYSFQYPLIGVRNAIPAQDWVAFGAAGLTQLLDQGIAQTTDMLAHDLSPEGRARWDIDTRRQSGRVGGQVFAGAPERQGEGWVWVRAGRNAAQSLQGYQPLTAGVQLASAPSPTSTSEAAAATVDDGTTAAVADSTLAVPEQAGGTASDPSETAASPLPRTPSDAVDNAPDVEASPTGGPAEG